MSKTGFLLCLFCNLVVCRTGFAGGGIIGGDQNRNEYERIIEIARKEIGVRESGGQNCGPRVEAYLAYAGARKGSPWCAGFISWVFGQAGYRKPRTAWSPALFPKNRVVEIASLPRNNDRFTPLLRGLNRAKGEFSAANQPQVKGLVLGIYFPSLRRIAHVGLVEYLRGDWVGTIEGNTSVAGGREGIGVFRRLRHRRAVHCYSDWIR
ncbi:peptidoglycan-binding protein [Pedobacter sp. GR22-6]|uniref:peptidoglycan-binding protein n=1 Tax=Pedobacter sp. GR22-6 TaxID=3127957 RepID=UPI00307DA643